MSRLGSRRPSAVIFSMTLGTVQKQEEDFIRNDGGLLKEFGTILIFDYSLCRKLHINIHIYRTGVCRDS